MRRFEFIEGASSKFWQIEREGAKLTIQWGKIGSAGQTQTKDFPNDAKASAEHDKLIAEKTKKGYAEVGAAPAPVDAPAPKPRKTVTPKAAEEPAPAALAVAPEPAKPVAPVEIDWSKLPVDRFLMTHRNGRYRPAEKWRAIDPWSEVQRVWRMFTPTFPFAMFTIAPELQRAAEEANVWLEASAPGPISPLGAAIVSVLLGVTLEEQWYPVGRAIIEPAVANYGPAWMIDAAEAAEYVDIDRYADPPTCKLIYARREPNQPYHHGWGLLHHLAFATQQLSEDAYAELCQVAEARWSSWTYFQKLRILKFLAGHPPLADKLGEEWLECNGHFEGVPGSEPDGIAPMLEFAYSRPILTKIAKKGVSRPYSGWFIQHAVWRLLDLVGADVVPVIKIHYEVTGSLDTDGVKVAALVRGPETAALMVSLLATKKELLAAATEWLEQHPTLAIPPLADALAGGAALADRAAPVFLAIDKKKPGLADSLELRPAARNAINKLREKMAPKPEAASSEIPWVLVNPPLTSGKSVTIGSWANVDKVPRPLLAGREKSLPKKAVENLFLILASSKPDQVHDGILALRKAGDRGSLEDFSWALFNEWLMAGAPSKEGWGFQQLGFFGGDEVARKLTPMIRVWPGENFQARAVAGLDILARIGSDLALMHLNGIAQKVKFKALQERARQKMDEIAKRRGLTADELADRLVPDLDLDADGSRTLDFGSRQFRVGFDEALKPVVVDGHGKTMSDLPKPNKSDDSAKAKEAETVWRTLKKDVKAIAQNQITRLELAMCAQRRWEIGSFQAMFLEHPLLVHLVRRLIWGVYTLDGARTGAFRVAEDSSLADAQDSAFTLPDGALVGIVHPLELTDSEKAAFGQILGDYGIMQPFAQIGRDTYAPTEEEAKDSAIKRREGQFVPVGKILGLVEKGWRKGPPQDAGWIWEMRKPLPGGLQASLDLRTGIGADMQFTEPKQEIGAIYLSRDRDRVALGKLGPVLFSELVRDLVQLGTVA